MFVWVTTPADDSPIEGNENSDDMISIVLTAYFSEFSISTRCTIANMDTEITKQNCLNKKGISNKQHSYQIYVVAYTATEIIFHHDWPDYRAWFKPLAVIQF